MAKQDRIDELVRLSLAFDRFIEMGIIGNTGKLANAESSRMNNRIVNLRKELEIDKQTLKQLKRDAILAGETFY